VPLTIGRSRYDQNALRTLRVASDYPEKAPADPIEQGKFTGSLSDLETDSNRPDILQLQGRFLPNQFPLIPGYTLLLQREWTVPRWLLHSVNDEPSLNQPRIGGLRPFVDGPG
jgi:hypothetical protein